MPDPLEQKRVILGVTGSIACYKAADLASKLTQAGAQVDVILSHGATRFITPLTFRAITHHPVVTDLFDPESELAMEHISLATQAHLLIVAPATANTIAKLALGLADDALTATALATTAPLLVAPAMDANMHAHPTVQENLKTLRGRGAHVVGPAQGRLASGMVGMGRMEEPATIMSHIRWVLGRDGDLARRHIVVSAGGTQEPIDPVRVVANRSSGKMGYAVAEAARDRGAHVTLVAAPTSLPDPPGVAVRHVATALEMRDAVLLACSNADALIMAAAVADFRPRSAASQKVKSAKNEMWSIELERNPDIIAEVDGGVIKVGFAAETEELLANARAKLASKGLHLIVANDVTAEGSGFGSDTNQVTLLEPDGHAEELPLLPKAEVGHRILDRVAELLAERDAAREAS
jgi:phosphopantothenoylcysteine decarboxylase/phosphopantothenate--cysteine ligase